MDKDKAQAESAKTPIQTHLMSPEQREAELKAKCASCADSRQWTQSVSKTAVMRHPLFACSNEQSPHYGVWLTGFATCPLHTLDEAKLERLLKRATSATPPQIIVPGGVMGHAPKRTRSKSKLSEPRTSSRSPWHEYMQGTK